MGRGLKAGCGEVEGGSRAGVIIEAGTPWDTAWTSASQACHVRAM